MVKNNKIITASVVLYDTELKKVRRMLSSLELQADNHIIYLYVIDHSRNKKYRNKLKSSKVNIFYIHRKNSGYGSGHNHALKKSLNSEFHVFLNPDIYFDKFLFDNLISHLKKNNSCVACSPIIRNPDHSYQFSGRSIPSITHLFLRRFFPNSLITNLLNIKDINSFKENDEIIASPSFSGAFIFMRKEIFKKVNGFDERFFMYLEDIDLSIRLKKYGEIHYLKKESIYHHFARGSYYKFTLFFEHVLSLIKFKIKYLFHKKDEIQQKKRIYVISTSPFIIKNFFDDHLKLLKKYDVIIFTNFNSFKDINLNNERLVAININIMRNIHIFRDCFTLVTLILIFLFSRPNMVISLGPKSGFLSGFAGFFSRIKSRVFIFQGQVWASKSGFFRSFLIFFDLLIAKLNNHLLSISNYEKNLLIKNNIVSNDKIKVLGKGSICGVNTNFPTKSTNKISKVVLGLDNKFIFSFIGRLNVDKGILNLIDSFNNLSNKNAQIHLLLIGPDEMNIKSHVNKKSNITIIPYQRDLASFYNLTDCLILPSFREGLPITILEAFVAKVPVIVSNIPSLKSLSKNDKALTFKVKDVKSLEEKMDKIYLDRDLRKKLSENAYKYVKHNFDKTRVVKRYIDYFESVLHG